MVMYLLGPQKCTNVRNDILYKVATRGSCNRMAVPWITHAW